VRELAPRRGAQPLLLANPASAATIDWVPVGNAGNAADTPSSNCWGGASCGSVAYDYWISKYEVTKCPVRGLLKREGGLRRVGPSTTRAWAATRPSAAFTRSGVSGSYSYTAKVGFENKPVTYVSFYDSLALLELAETTGRGVATRRRARTRCSAGRPRRATGTTVTRNGGASIFLTSENEWYKAALTTARPASIFDYPTGTNSVAGLRCAGLGHRQLGELRT